MANWKRTLVGDSFRLPSPDANYYRDFALFWPFLLFLVAAVASAFDSSFGRSFFYKSLTLTLICFLLAKERLFLLAVATGFVAIRSAPALVFLINSEVFPQLLVVFALSATVFFGATFYILRVRDDALSYKIPDGITLAQLLIGLGSLGTTLAVFVYWVRD